jgi:long-chain acyl-CoA synthetase
MNLARAFAESASKHAGRTALFYGEEEISYGTLLKQTCAVARALSGEFGVTPGDRVALWLKNRPEFIPAWMGVQLAGGVVVPINNFLKPDEVLHMVEDSDARVLITDSSMAEPVAKLTAARPQLRVWTVENLASASGAVSPGEPSLPARAQEDLAVLIYTSGTTGRPKGAMLSHGNLLHNIESCRQVLEAVPHDRFVVLLPLFHSFMMTVGMLLPLLTGGSMVLIRSLHPPKNILAEILQRRATLLPAVPQFFRTLAHAGLPPDCPLRVCVSGGAPLPLEILNEFNARMPIPLIEGYGLSEASPVVSLNPLRGPWKAGSIGVPIPDVEVTVQDDDGRMLGDGETGEICVRGGNVMLGYWNKPEETAASIRNGWLLTGDIGHRASDGYFHITDRKKDMLLVNGINVYPREIEEVLYKFPGVKEAAVIGVPDARRGEQPLAFVVAMDGVTLQEKAIQAFVRERLADYKVPRRVNFMTALPRNATGKVLKTALRATAAESTTQE